MFIIIIAIVFAIVTFVFFGLDFKEEQFKLNKKQLLAVLPLLLILLNLFTIVPANHVGILYSPFEGVREETISEGLKKKGILDKVYKINTEVQTVKLQGITGQTKDSQWVDMIIDVKYKVNPGTAFQVFQQYRNLENVGINLIPSTVQRSIESITTQYNVMDILGEARNNVYIGIEQELKTRLATTGIEFISINFIDTDAGPGIEAAIEKQAIAKQAVETAEEERQKAEIEAQKAVVTAEADKQAASIKAETKLIEATAEAEANKKLSESITPQLIEKMEMEARLKHGWVTIQGGNPIVDTRAK